MVGYSKFYTTDTNYTNQKYHAAHAILVCALQGTPVWKHRLNYQNLDNYWDKGGSYKDNPHLNKTVFNIQTALSEIPLRLKDIQEKQNLIGKQVGLKSR